MRQTSISGGTHRTKPRLEPRPTSCIDLDEQIVDAWPLGRGYVPVVDEYRTSSTAHVHILVPRYGRFSLWRVMSVPRFAEQSIERELQHLGSGVITVLRCDEVAADEQREDQHAAGLDIVLIHAELPEQ